MSYQYKHHGWQPCPEARDETVRHKAIIVGGGPVGLTTALELAAYGVPSVVLEDGDTVSEGSRGLCWSKRTLEILDRHGVAEQVRARGYTWHTGRLFHGDREIYHFDLQAVAGEKFPAFVNLQQYYTEEFLVDAVARQPLIDHRWQSKVVDVAPGNDCVAVEVETPAGRYRAEADWLVAADGTRSAARRALGLKFDGSTFEDCFLIADLKVHAALPNADRRFWFHPSFHPGDTALCHKQGDDMWRVDFQLGADIDREAEKDPARVIARAQKMLGPHPMTVEWVSIYTFQGRRLERLRHGRVLFAGDAAHQVSPFGARGGNSGIQDAENLAWKLAYVIRGKAPDRLLDSYDAERGEAADENILLTSRSTRFLTPKTAAERVFRDAVLDLAGEHPFARALVNSGRLSTATIHRRSPLNGGDGGFAGGVAVGGPCPNLPAPAATGSHLLDSLGRRFQLLCFADGAPAPAALVELDDDIEPILVTRGAARSQGAPQSLADPDGRLHDAFAAQPGTCYLLRPDQHVAARWRRFDADAVKSARDRALGY
ncbi:FAD-dependent oxidoreductase [Desertibaculum subflavum]|uniref:FAD-dependent oxidoreductase n=1 Tax=Desertibaculum subflavum TaxID=2268458 RepID=UPI0034D1B2AB